MRMFVGCSSMEDIPSRYINDCRNILNELFKRNYDLVFGACSKGIMGLAYDCALDNNKNIIGIYPDIYEDEAKNLCCSKISVRNVCERTNQLIENSDILLFMPGGIGTIYELFSVIEYKRGLEFDKPIIIYNSCGYFDRLLGFIELMKEENFVSNETLSNYYVCDNIDDMLGYIDNYYK